MNTNEICHFVRRQDSHKKLFLETLFYILRPMFLPDPKDGSLYMLNSENQSDLKKLQFTIQQLVSSSPCRSTDGIFYTGLFAQNVCNHYSKFLFEKQIKNFFRISIRVAKSVKFFSFIICSENFQDTKTYWKKQIIREHDKNILWMFHVTHLVSILSTGST